MKSNKTIDDLIAQELTTDDQFYADMIECLPMNVETLVHHVAERYASDKTQQLETALARCHHQNWNSHQGEYQPHPLLVKA